MKKKAILLLLFMSLLPACSEKSEEATERESVLYAEIEQKPLRIATNLPGRVSPFVVSEVRPQVSGIITERLFEEGSDVEKGQPLYQIDPALYQAAYDKAKAELAEARARLNMLEQQKRRKQKLAGAKAVSQQDLENIVSESEQARAQVAKAKADLDMAAINLAYTTIKAPVSGRIGTSSVTPGALVTINQPEPLATIQQTAKVYVDINQSSADILRLQRDIADGTLTVKNNAAEVGLLLEDGTMYTGNGKEGILGKLLVSDISVNPRTGSVNLRAVFDNPDGLLLPGMYVTAILEHGIRNHALMVPQRAVMGAGGDRCKVFVLRPVPDMDNEFIVEAREIDLDGASGMDWVVGSGLEPDDKIVVEGLQKIVPGDRVTGKKFVRDSSEIVWKSWEN